MPKFKKLSITILIAICGLSASGQIKKGKPVNVIFDTDIATDYDDVGAITLLHYYADNGQAKILATIASTKYPRVAAVLSVLNTYFKKPDIPIGVPTGLASEDADSQKWSDSITAKYPHKIESNSGAIDAVELYRKILTKQSDNSVTIITVGFFSNIVNLLKSGPDKYSALTGLQLVNKKVRKMVSMAGQYPSGSEYNMNNDSVASKYVFSHWTKPVIFSGFEIGEKIHTGLPLIHNDKIMKDPVKDVFRISIPESADDVNGRMSWDETAVFVAIHGPAPYYKLISGKVIVNHDGSNGWTTPGNQYYLLAVRPPAEMQQVINNLIMHQPKK
jgi:pyrimidine-specific ribonucleoside hydrolase